MGEISSLHKIFVDVTFGKNDDILQYFLRTYYNILLCFQKGKAVPLQAWSGPGPPGS
jgi:hypothetical protein